MSTPRNMLYFSRFKKHIHDTHKHLTESDSVQASEKIWGALSSLVNINSIREITGVAEKKEAFENLYRRLCVKHDHLRGVLTIRHFRDAYDLASKAEGLHMYFFGGRSYPENYIKAVVEDCVQVFEEVEKVL
jgi:hypothetical protein